jgi:hypothetical protein
MAQGLQERGTFDGQLHSGFRPVAATRNSTADRRG